MATDNNELIFKLFGSDATNKYKPVEWGDITNEINPNDANVVNLIRGNSEWEKGVEGFTVSTTEGTFAYTTGNLENAKGLVNDALLQNYILPRGIYRYSAHILYNIDSPCFEFSTGKIFLSLQNDNKGNPLSNATFWEDTGLTIHNYLRILSESQNQQNLETLWENNKLVISDAGLGNSNIVNFRLGYIKFENGTIKGVLDPSFLQYTPTGLVANTDYFLFAIYNPTTDTVQFHRDTSRYSPTLPSGFTTKRYLGAFRTNASGNIIPARYFAKVNNSGTRNGDNLIVRYQTPIVHLVSNTITITNQTITLSVPSIPIRPDLTWRWRTQTTVTIDGDVIFDINPGEVPFVEYRQRCYLNTLGGSLDQTFNDICGQMIIGDRNIRYRGEVDVTIIQPNLYLHGYTDLTYNY